MDKKSPHIMSDMMPVQKTHKKESPFKVEKKVERVERPTERIERHVEKHDVIQRVHPLVHRPIPRVEEYSYSNNGSRRKGFVWVLAIMGIVAIAIAIGGLFAHATIEIIPKVFTGAVDATISMSQVPAQGNLFFATATKTFSDEKIIPATNFTDQETFATGTVRIYNANTSPKTIPAGTVIVSTKKNQYIIKKKSVIPAQKLKIPGQLDVVITAIASGSEYNSDPDDFTFLKTSKTMDGVTVRSVKALTGGSKGREAIADQNQIDSATGELKKSFTDIGTLTARMVSDIPDDMIALPIVISGLGTAVTTETNHADGVHVIAKSTISIILVKRAELARALATKLSVTPDIAVTLKKLDGLTILANNAIAIQSLPINMTIRVSGTATIVGDIDTDQLKTVSVGVPKKQVKDILKQNSSIASFTIRMLPFWRRTMPMDGEDIDIVIQ